MMYTPGMTQKPKREPTREPWSGKVTGTQETWAGVEVFNIRVEKVYDAKADARLYRVTVRNEWTGEEVRRDYDQTYTNRAVDAASDALSWL